MDGEIERKTKGVTYCRGPKKHFILVGTIELNSL